MTKPNNNTIDTTQVNTEALINFVYADAVRWASGFVNAEAREYKVLVKQHNKKNCINKNSPQ